MGYREADAVIESALKNPLKAVAIALAKHVNSKSGSKEIWPGTKTLMRLSGCSRSTVQRGIDILAEMGIVEVLSEGKGNESSHYLFHTDKLVSESYQCRSDTTRGVRETLLGDDVVAERHQGGGGELPGAVSERHPNREYNLESNQELLFNRQAEAASDAVAASVTSIPTEKERTLLDYWYSKRLGLEGTPEAPAINQVSSSRIENDLPFAREIVRLLDAKGVTSNNTFLLFIFTSEPNPDSNWDGWDKKCPNLRSIVKHIKTGELVHQFRQWVEELEALESDTPGSASPLVRAEVEEAFRILPKADPADILEEEMGFEADNGEFFDPSYDPADHEPLDEDTIAYLRQCDELKQRLREERAALLAALPEAEAKAILSGQRPVPDLDGITD